MAGRHSKRGKGQKIETPDLELMPMLNVFISIIPMLLLSAAFVQLAVIDTGLPASAVAATPVESKEDAPPPPVTIHIRANDFVVETAGAPPRSIARASAAEPADDPGRLPLEALLRTIASQHEKKPEVRIVPAVRTRYDEIIFIMDLARSAGMSNAALADAGPGAV